MTLFFSMGKPKLLQVTIKGMGFIDRLKFALIILFDSSMTALNSKTVQIKYSQEFLDIMNLKEKRPMCWDCRQSPDNLCAKHRANKEAK